MTDPENRHRRSHPLTRLRNYFPDRICYLRALGDYRLSGLEFHRMGGWMGEAVYSCRLQSGFVSSFFDPGVWADCCLLPDHACWIFDCELYWPNGRSLRRRPVRPNAFSPKSVLRSQTNIPNGFFPNKILPLKKSGSLSIPVKVCSRLYLSPRIQKARLAQS